MIEPGNGVCVDNEVDILSELMCFENVELYARMNRSEEVRQTNLNVENYITGGGFGKVTKVS